MKTNNINLLNIFNLAAVILMVASVAQADITWKGYTWTVKSATGEGPGPNDWSETNVFIDDDGSLHMKISYDKDSGKWDCAEVNTTDDLGFGTYQWQVESRIDTFDPNVVLGLFPYAGPDGNNEIDIEYSTWSKVGGDNGGWTVYPDSGTNIGHESFKFTLDGTYTTSRLTWSKSGIQYWLMGGFQPVGTNNNVIKSWNYTPDNPSVNIPQHPMPLHMNLWLCRKHLAPSDGQPVEVIIHDFKFIPNP